MKDGPDWLLRFCCICLVAIQCLGCAKHSGSGSGGTPGSGSTTPPTVDLTGNWQFEVTSSGNVPFSTLSGFLNEQPSSSGDSFPMTASVLVQSNSCFAGSKVLDLSGFTKDPYSQLVAFPSYGQTVTLSLSSSCTNVSLCGSFSVSGGCANGMSGDIVAVKYTQLNGSFQTAAASPQSLKMSLTQSSQGTGQGYFGVSGTLAFTGVSCLTAVTLDPTQSYLSGSSLHLVATTNAANAAVMTMDGTINVAATGVTLNQVSLAGSSCLDPLNGAGLTQQM